MFETDEEVLQRVHALAEMLTSEDLRMAAAESCTGGLLAGACTALPGSSNWFQGGVVAYDNAVKTDVLGVPRGILEQHGAVSLETVQAMASGICGLLRVAAGVAVSGVAGPGGGTVEKPVGTVCIGLCLEGAVHSDVFHFAGDRAAVRRQSVLMGLQMLADMLQHKREAGRHKNGDCQ